MIFFQIFGELEQIYYFCSMNEDIRERAQSNTRARLIPPDES